MLDAGAKLLQRGGKGHLLLVHGLDAASPKDTLVALALDAHRTHDVGAGAGQDHARVTDDRGALAIWVAVLIEHPAALQGDALLAGLPLLHAPQILPQGDGVLAVAECLQALADHLVRDGGGLGVLQPCEEVARVVGVSGQAGEHVQEAADILAGHVALRVGHVLGDHLGHLQPLLGQQGVRDALHHGEVAALVPTTQVQFVHVLDVAVPLGGRSLRVPRPAHTSRDRATVLIEAAGSGGLVLDELGDVTARDGATLQRGQGEGIGSLDQRVPGQRQLRVGPNVGEGVPLGLVLHHEGAQVVVQEVKEALLAVEHPVGDGAGLCDRFGLGCQCLHHAPLDVGLALPERGGVGLGTVSRLLDHWVAGVRPRLGQFATDREVHGRPQVEQGRLRQGLVLGHPLRGLPDGLRQVADGAVLQRLRPQLRARGDVGGLTVELQGIPATAHASGDVARHGVQRHVEDVPTLQRVLARGQPAHPLQRGGSGAAGIDGRVERLHARAHPVHHTQRQASTGQEFGTLGSTLGERTSTAEEDEVRGIHRQRAGEVDHRVVRQLLVGVVEDAAATLRHVLHVLVREPALLGDVPQFGHGQVARDAASTREPRGDPVHLVRGSLAPDGPESVHHARVDGCSGQAVQALVGVAHGLRGTAQ